MKRASFFTRIPHRVDLGVDLEYSRRRSIRFHIVGFVGGCILAVFAFIFARLIGGN